MTGITLWSILTAACAGVKTYSQFFVARMGVGVGEATLSPSAYSMIADYFPGSKRAVAMSVFTMGIFLGSGLALAIGSVLVSKLPTEGMLEVPWLGEIYHWQKLFLMVGLPGIAIAILMLTVREPQRKGKLQAAGTDVNLSLSDALKIVFTRPTAYLSLCFGTAFTAMVNYGCTAWVPTYLNRTFGWSVPKAGLAFGLVLLIGSVSGILWGGWYADKLRARGIANGRVRIGVIAGLVATLSFFIPLVPHPGTVLGLLFVPAFFLASPMGAATTAVQEMMPNQARALASAIFLFFINVIGLGIGPSLVAVFTDYVFRDESAIRYSMTALFLSGGVFALLFYSIAAQTYASTIVQLPKNK